MMGFWQPNLPTTNSLYAIVNFTEALVVEARKELFEIREGILKLMDEFRGRGA